MRPSRSPRVEAAAPDCLTYRVLLFVEVNSFLDLVREQAETIRRTILDGAAG